MEPTTQLDHVVPTLRDLVAGTTSSQMANATPCDGWQVRDLMNHLICGAHMFAGAFMGAPTHDLSDDLPDAAGDEPLAAFDAAVANFQTALTAPGAMNRTLPLAFGPMAVPEALRFVAFDLTVHSWDLSKATGQGFVPSDGIVREVEATARRMLIPEMRDGVQFDAEAAAPAGADDIDRLAAFSGRRL